MYKLRVVELLSELLELKIVETLNSVKIDTSIRMILF